MRRNLLFERMEARRLLATIDLAALAPDHGSVIYGAEAGDGIGWTSNNAGDFNGDGYDDMVIGGAFTPGLDNLEPSAGEVYVVFGGPNFPATVDLQNLGSAGIKIYGADAGDRLGNVGAIGSAGDVNGDNIDDLLIGAHGGDGPANNEAEAGESYIIFGSENLPQEIDLANLGSNGVTVYGAEFGDRAYKVAGVGDINADGLNDVLIGAIGAGPDYTGAAYVFYGRTTWDQTVDLAATAADVTLYGRVPGNSPYSGGIFGGTTSAAGDVNGDGIDDFMIGDSRAASGGEVYVFLGSSTLPSVIDLAAPGTTADIEIQAANLDDQLGSRAIGSAGDVNGDGIDDLLIGSTSVEEVDFVVYGSENPLATIDLANLGSAGIVLHGVRILWGGLASEDVNGDGYDDVIVGSRGKNGVDGLREGSGSTYVVFGGNNLPSDIDLTEMGEAGLTIYGAEAGDASGSGVAAGDVNGDGIGDILIGAIGGDGVGNGKEGSGESYVIYGSNAFTSSVTHLGTENSETLTGSVAADVMVGGRGNDTLLGGGGADVISGGQGDDVLSIGDLTFRRLVGGSGIDTLRLDGSGLQLDLTAIPDNRLQDIEAIDLTGTGNNALTLTQREVLYLSSDSNTLVVRGDADDVVNMEAGWTRQTDETIDSELFHVFTQGAATLKVQSQSSVLPTVFAGRLFTNNSFFDGNSGAANANDDAAVLDKVPLRIGMATPENVTNYSRGINGVMVDIVNPAGEVTLADFEFRVGNDNDPSGWAAAPNPTQVIVRPGSGASGTSRVTLVWPDNAIEKTWLQVTVKANANTGLTTPDVFYFGNAIGDVGNSLTDAIVNATDIAAVVQNQNTFMNPAPITSPYDMNRDRQINATDIGIVVENQTSFLNALRMITIGSGSLFGSRGSGGGTAPGSPVDGLGGSVPPIPPTRGGKYGSGAQGLQALTSSPSVAARPTVSPKIATSVSTRALAVDHLMARMLTLPSNQADPAEDPWSPEAFEDSQLGSKGSVVSKVFEFESEQDN